MTEFSQFANLPDQELERVLIDLGHAVEFPPTPNVAGAIRARLEAEPATQATFDGKDKARFLKPWRAVAVAAAVILLFLGAALIGLPNFRPAVADHLGVRGIKITFEDKTPTPAASPVGDSLLLGNRVTLDEAKAAVGFDLKMPTLPGVGEPDEVYLRTLPDGQPMVSFIYYPSDALPETEETGVGALLMQFETNVDIPMMGKAISNGGEMFAVDVGGERDQGYFISGPSNFIMSLDPSQISCCDSQYSRPSGNVLLWSHDPVTYRLESSLDSVDSVGIAESLQPVP
jgi:hypothetical protein